MSAIIIKDSRPSGRQIAFFNEAGLDRGPKKYEQELEALYNKICRWLPYMTVYTVVMRWPRGLPWKWAKAYIDFTVDDPSVMLARMARLLQKDPQAAAGYDIDYDPAENLLHVGLWIPHENTRSCLMERLKLLNEMERG